MRGWFNKLKTVAVALAVVFLASAEGSVARADSRIIILDATNSMWGPIEGVRKYRIARDAIKTAAREMSSSARLGLYVVGNTPGAGCDTVTEALAPAPLDRRTLDQALEQAIPERGRMPLFPAIEQAAKSIQASSGEGRILVVSDGAGTCVAEVCSAARDLKKRISGMRVDAVSLDADAQARKRLQCITDGTGGAFRNAESPDQVIAFVKTVLADAAPSDLPKPKPEAARQADVPPLPAANPFRPGQSPGVSLRAVLSQGGDPIQKGLAWQVFDADSAGDEADVIWRGAAAQPAINLPQGTYRVRVRYGLIDAEREIEIRSRRAQTVTIDLNAGILKLSGAARAGGEPLSDLFYYVHKLAADDSTADTLIARTSKPQPKLYLPAGTYRVLARHGLAEAAARVELKAGAVLGRNLSLNAGTLQLKAQLEPGQPAPPDTVFHVFEERGEGQWEEVVRSAQRNPSLILPAGTYRVEARVGAAHERVLVQIEEGVIVERTLTLPAGRLRLETRLKGRSEPLNSNLVYKMFKLDGGQPKLVQTSAQAQFESFLPEGRYRVVSAYGFGNAVEEREVIIAPGKTKTVEFTHNSGKAQLGLVKAKGGLTLRQVTWSIRDSDGKEIYSSSDPVPELSLRAGQYVAIATWRNKQARAAFTISPGRPNVVEVLVQ